MFNNTWMVFIRREATGRDECQIHFFSRSRLFVIDRLNISLANGVCLEFYLPSCWHSCGLYLSNFYEIVRSDERWQSSKTIALLQMAYPHWLWPCPNWEPSSVEVFPGRHARINVDWGMPIPNIRKVDRYIAYILFDTTNQVPLFWHRSMTHPWSPREFEIEIEIKVYLNA